MLPLFAFQQGKSKQKIVDFFVFSPLPAAGCGGNAAGVGGRVCVGEIGLLFDIFGAPPGDGATYTLQHNASHCSTLHRTTTHVT